MINKRSYIQYGVILGVLICISLIVIAVIGIYAANIYQEQQAQKRAIKEAQIAQYQAYLRTETARCNQLGYEKYNEARDVCYTEQKSHRSTYNYAEMQTR